MLPEEGSGKAAVRGARVHGRRFDLRALARGDLGALCGDRSPSLLNPSSSNVGEDVPFSRAGGLLLGTY